MKVLSSDEIVRLFENHAVKWKTLKTANGLGWNNFPWPVFRRPSEPEEITPTAVSAYVLSRYSPVDPAKNSKDRIKDQLKLWHPDKFETKYLTRVAEDERDKVKEGAGAVSRALSELLNRNYDD
ncbi:hypothetical protein FA95DRAFT_1584265 [Auriscalpium vulgare]|uniref:Uncharacterized protein n=1 Tax=Auriscalpium vulgare TaxID=40419 RepID=A0ACB8RFU4_9AGAM|nr:hypothetical protein FA95DRAFT_1584265 [Auriscalpium vulgare]